MQLINKEAIVQYLMKTRNEMQAVRNPCIKESKKYNLYYNHWVPLTNGICKYTTVLQRKQIKHSLLNNLEAL